MYDVNEPDKLQPLEKALSEGPMPDPQLRYRVANSVAGELGGPWTKPHWQFAGLSVITILLGILLWMSLRGHGPMPIPPAPPATEREGMTPLQLPANSWERQMLDDVARGRGESADSQPSASAPAQTAPGR